jgi:putative SOS response-associated peptidase YedK
MDQVCGRYAVTRNPAALAAEFGAADETDGAAPAADYNVAPSKDVSALACRHRSGEEGRVLRTVRWGLVPHWASDTQIGARMINARAETVAEKPAFRTSLRKRRCILPADGWYEWRRGDATAKQPYFMTWRDSDRSVALAGIFAVWRDPAAGEATPPLVTCAVITTEARGQLADVHPRMPLVLPDESWPEWLDPALGDVSELLLGPPDELLASMECRPVSRRVNNVRNNDAGLLEAV